MAARAVKPLRVGKRRAEVKPLLRQESLVYAVPTEKKSRLAAKMCAGEKVTSVELVPPKSSDMTALLDRARKCAEAGVDAINIPDGPRASARVSPMISALTILQQVGIEPILHYCCRDRNLIGMQSDLLGGYAAKLANFLIITGDPPKLGEYPDVTGVFDVDSIGLVQVAANLNRGLDIGGNPIDPPTGLFLGVGANPSRGRPGTRDRAVLPEDRRGGGIRHHTAGVRSRGAAAVPRPRGDVPPEDPRARGGRGRSSASRTPSS